MLGTEEADDQELLEWCLSFEEAAALEAEEDPVVELKELPAADEEGWCWCWWCDELLFHAEDDGETGDDDVWVDECQLLEEGTELELDDFHDSRDEWDELDELGSQLELELDLAHSPECKEALELHALDGEGLDEDHQLESEEWDS